MAKWTDLGHAMRRRVGAPSNHLESAGPSSGRQHITSDEAHELAKNSNSVRIPLGDEPMEKNNPVMSEQQDADDYAASAAAPQAGTLMPKHNMQAGDPTGYGAGVRQNVMYSEKLGASHRITANTDVMIDPAAGATMANARIIPSVQGRQAPNFAAGNQDSYL